MFLFAHIGTRKSAHSDERFGECLFSLKARELEKVLREKDEVKITSTERETVFHHLYTNCRVGALTNVTVR